jgi:ComEC/Rec2-related protein
MQSAFFIFILMVLPLSWKFLALFSLGFFDPTNGIGFLLALPFLWQSLKRKSFILGLTYLAIPLFGFFLKPKHETERPYQRISAKLLLSPNGNYEHPKQRYITATVLWGSQADIGTQVLWKLPYQSSLDPNPGELWQVEGFLEWPSTMQRSNAFQIRNWLEHLNVDYLLSAKKQNIRCLDQYPSTTPGLREQWIKHFSNRARGNSAKSLMMAMAMGEKSMLPKDIKTWFAQAGLSHVLAVSGLHAGLIFGLFIWLLKPLPNHKTGFRLLRFVCLSIALWTYAWLTGFSASVTRVCLMMNVYALAGLGRTKVNTLHTLGLAALFMLSIDKEYLNLPGFQLSFLAVAGILILVPKLENKRPKKVPKWLWSGMSATLAAQLYTTPLALYHFGSFPWLFLLNNLIGIPLGALTLYAANAWLLWEAFGFEAWLPMDWFWELPARLLIYWVSITGAHDWVSLEGASISLQWVLWLYALLLILSFAFKKPVYKKLALGMVWVWGISLSLSQATKGHFFYLEAQGNGFNLYKGSELWFQLQAEPKQNSKAYKVQNYKLACLTREEIPDFKTEIILWLHHKPPSEAFLNAFPAHTLWLVPYPMDACSVCIFPSKTGGVVWTM